MIYFVTNELGQAVHAGCYGFTTSLYEYVECDAEADVPGAAQAWCNRLGLQFTKVRGLSPAREQNRSQHCFPEQIIGPDGASSHKIV